MRPLIEYRKKNGLCYDCGCPAEEGKRRCRFCAAKRSAYAKNRYHADRAYRETHGEYVKEWLSENPERAEVYKSRKAIYNRRYREK